MKNSSHTDITPAQLAARQANAAKATEARKQAKSAARAEAEAALTAANVPRFEISEARLMFAKAQLAEIDLAERRGELVSVAEAEARWIDIVTTIKTLVLGVPSRFAQRRPTLAAEVPLLKELLRETLEEIATDGSDVE